MSFGKEEIYVALNQTAITGLLDSYSTGKALFSQMIMPSDYTGFKSINFYMTTAYNGGSNFEQYFYTANCRAKTQGEAMTIAKAAFDNINRSHFTGFYTVCSILPVIPPADDRDTYNIPVEIILKKR